MKCPHCNADNSDEARFCGVCGRATAATEPSYQDLAPPGGVTAPDLIGREIAGRYRVLAKLGEGGMGAVYRAEQISLKRKVAIKVLRPELSRDPGIVRRFNHEAELVARLSHPNTVNIYDFGQDADGSLFIAMEFLEGRSLRQLMTQDGPLPPWRALAITRQIATSLSDAHSHGIVHRDLKPDNVMLIDRGKERDIVRVLDFGIAKVNRQTVNVMTRAGDLVGTPQYMAPEQIKGEAVDGRTDIYALGAMLYEMLTGRLPFEGATVMAILSKHLLDPAEPPTVRRPDLGLPPALDGLVMSAMAKDPAHRPATMDQICEHVTALAAQLGGGPASQQVPATVPSAAWSAQQGVVAPTGHGGMGPPHGAMPSGPPPGVPRTHPPGLDPRSAPTPPPMGPPPGPAPYGAPPMPGYPQPPAHHAPPRPASRAPIYIAVGVVLAAAAGVAIFLGVQASQDDEPGTGTGTGTATIADPSDPWSGGGGGGGTPVAIPDPPDKPDPPEAPPAPSGWSGYQSPDLGWTLRLPPGVSSTPTFANGAANFTGSQGSTTLVVGVLATPNAGKKPTTAELDEFAGNLATTLGATIIESGSAVTQGTKRYRVVMETAVDKAEARFFIEPGIIVMAYYTRTADWDASSGERREFFEGVGLPGGAP